MINWLMKKYYATYFIEIKLETSINQELQLPDDCPNPRSIYSASGQLWMNLFRGACAGCNRELYFWLQDYVVTNSWIESWIENPDSLFYIVYGAMLSATESGNIDIFKSVLFQSFLFKTTQIHPTSFNKIMWNESLGVACLYSYYDLITYIIESGANSTDYAIWNIVVKKSLYGNDDFFFKNNVDSKISRQEHMRHNIGCQGMSNNNNNDSRQLKQQQISTLCFVIRKFKKHFLPIRLDMMVEGALFVQNNYLLAVGIFNNINIPSISRVDNRFHQTNLGYDFVLSHYCLEELFKRHVKCTTWIKNNKLNFPLLGCELKNVVTNVVKKRKYLMKMVQLLLNCSIPNVITKFIVLPFISF